MFGPKIEFRKEKISFFKDFLTILTKISHFFIKKYVEKRMKNVQN